MCLLNILYLIAHHEGKSGQEPKAGTRRQELTEAETMEECSFLPCFPGSLSLLSYTTHQGHLPRGRAAHSGLGPLRSITSQEVSPLSFLQATLMDTVLHLPKPTCDGLCRTTPLHLCPQQH